MFLKYLTLYLIQKGVDLLKRTLDLFLIILSLPFVLPIYLLITLLVLTQLNSPVLFRQSRPGLNRKIFNIYKFKTMTDECDKDGILLPDEARLTKFGKFLRSTSLFDLDVWYVDNQSIWLDIKILWLTVKKVIMRDGINQVGQSTMESFKGNDNEK